MGYLSSYVTNGWNQKLATTSLNCCYQRELFYSFSETIRSIIHLNSRFCCPYCWLPIEKAPAVIDLKYLEIPLRWKRFPLNFLCQIYRVDLVRCNGLMGVFSLIFNADPKNAKSAFFFQITSREGRNNGWDEHWILQIVVTPTCQEELGKVRFNFLGGDEHWSLSIRPNPSPKRI